VRTHVAGRASGRWPRPHPCSRVGRELRVPACRKGWGRGEGSRRGVPHTVATPRLSEATNSVELRSPVVRLPVASGGGLVAAPWRCCSTGVRREATAEFSSPEWIGKRYIATAGSGRLRPAALPSRSKISYKQAGRSPHAPLLIQIYFVIRFVECVTACRSWLSREVIPHSLFKKGPAITNSRSGNHQYALHKMVRQPPIGGCPNSSAFGD
jgi:hypothetical protein